jgi:hypothetical protein
MTANATSTDLRQDMLRLAENEDLRVLTDSEIDAVSGGTAIDYGFYVMLAIASVLIK